MPYDLKVLKIIKHNKKIFNLSYWTGLYDQNCRIYPPFYIFRYTGPMVTRYTGGLSQFPVVEMSWEKTLYSKQLLFSGQFDQTHWSHGHHGHQVHRRSIYIKMSWGKKSKNSVLINFHFLVKVTSTRVTRECQICIKIEFEDEYPWKQWIWVEKLIFPVSVTQKEQLSGVFIFDFEKSAFMRHPTQVYTLQL